MRMLVGVVAVSLSLAACSGADDPPPPTQCKRTDRSGTYLQSYTKTGGTCPELDAEIVDFNAPVGSGGSTGCRVTSERWSEGDCKLERSVACSAANGDRSSAVGVSRQQTQGGSLVTGTLTIVVTLSNGASCRGTYAVTAQRQ